MLRIQLRLKPYLETVSSDLESDEGTENQTHKRNFSNNQLEYYEIITGSFTIYSTIIFEDHEDKQVVIQFITFIAGK